MAPLGMTVLTWMPHWTSPQRSRHARISRERRAAEEPPCAEEAEDADLTTPRFESMVMSDARETSLSFVVDLSEMFVVALAGSVFCNFSI